MQLWESQYFLLLFKFLFMEDIQNTLIALQYNFLVYIIEMTFIKLNKMINLIREGANEIIIKLGSFSGQVEAEIFEVKDTRGQFQFLHFCVILSHFSE